MSDLSYHDQAYWLRKFKQDPREFSNALEKWQIIATDACDTLTEPHSFGRVDLEFKYLSELIVAFCDSEIPATGAGHFLDVYRQLFTLSMREPNNWSGSPLSKDEMETSIHRSLDIISRIRSALGAKIALQVPETPEIEIFGANNPGLFVGEMPKNEKVIKLVTLLDNERRLPKKERRKWNPIAREFTGEDTKSFPKAKSLLSIINRLRHAGRVTLDQ